MANQESTGVALRRSAVSESNIASKPSLLRAAQRDTIRHDQILSAQRPPQLADDLRVCRRQCLRSGLRGLPLMAMHNPPHPGEFITEIYLAPHGVSGRELASRLDVAPSTLSRVLKGNSRVTPDMALRLSKALGRSPESWLAMQDAHDLWLARQSTDLARVSKLELAAA
ncbi:HigA family addiction module antitoxin [Thauera sp. JM12B12]|uniref:HigA family addiction module antitoxin n=1 Tax=Thauera sp. JM12B12 TaxID=3142262 RepID=UPI0031F40CCC